jgi:hypothetical protein
MVGLVVGEEALVQEHPKAVADATNQSSDISLDISMKSRRQIKRWHGDGAAHLGFQEIWWEWCGYTTAAGYTELPLPPPPSAPPRPMRRTKRRRRHKRAGGPAPAHGEPSIAAEENSHSLRQEGDYLLRRKKGEGRRRAVS